MQLSNELKNSSETNQSGTPAILDNISEYDKQMIVKYQSEIEDFSLTISWNPDLKSLDFVKFLVIYKLELLSCKNIIPKLESQTIKRLELTYCDIQSVKDLQLDNLEVLKIYNTQNKLESNTLAQEIVRFKNLKELTLYNCITDCITDFSILSQMTGLTKLCVMQCNLCSTEALRPLTNLEELYPNYNKVGITTLQYFTNLTKLSLLECNLVNIDALRPLVNLDELYLNSNKDIDITTVQYLTNLCKLQLVSCNLVSLDVLRLLKKLEELDIFNNNIVYLLPLVELKEISQLDVKNNKIIDCQAIKLHSNFNNFGLDDQELPTQEELQTANILRDINSPITCLKQMRKISRHIKNENFVFKKKITQQLQVSYNSHEQLVTQAALLLQKMNMYDGCQ
ncbi:DUF2252_family protein [Hexamita inflata]|uniref:DUF2252 family protein n=1 Tax=Hexamita inflata TaxID=28002 RepID=A0AA86TMP5_9EUKA|nr:DUF2252 family protein [Hexamita inflata]